MMLCDDSVSIESNRISSHHSNKVTLNSLTMILCDDSVSIESNQISLHQFEQGDVEPIDHDALQ